MGTVASGQKPSRTIRLGLVALTSLFFIWGFVTSLNDILVPHLRGVFTLSYAQGALVQFAFFLAYLCSSLPAGAVVSHFGYKKGLAGGLMTMALGACLFVPAAFLLSFPMFLLALFILASGITLLQVAANPYVTLLGSPETASSRLNLTQAFNSLGTTIAPLIGGHLILGTTGNWATPRAQAATVVDPYVALALILIVLAVSFFFSPLPEPKESPEELSWQTVKESLAVPTLRLGTLGIFVYVGAEVAIGSFLINLITSSLSLSGGEKEAAMYVSLYWGGAMVGRFLGSWLMTFIRPARLLTVAAVGAMALLLLSYLSSGHVAIYSIVAVGLCNAIMFPTIFSLGVQGLGSLTGVGSSLMIMAIVGGAVVPLGVGVLADTLGLKTALLSPVACYLYIAFYAVFCAGRQAMKSKTISAA